MSLQVIGAGFGRTGTLSLKLALEEIGFGPCYHMIETRAHPEHDALWLDLASGRSNDWSTILAGYRSSVDWPAVLIWKRLVAENPNAKVILTLRDPERWYASASKTIFARMQQYEAALRTPDGARGDPERDNHMRMVNEIVLRKSFGGDLGRDNAIRIFDAHNDEVRRTVPPGRLLIYEPGQGWEPLCVFLGVAIPEAPYPKVNSTADFAARFPNEPR